jgi:ribosomal small subunit protein bTHX
MGKGDKKSAKGKRSMGSYGNTRKRKADKPVVTAAKPKKEKVADAKETAKKPAAKKPAAKKPAAKPAVSPAAAWPFPTGGRP